MIGLNNSDLEQLHTVLSYNTVLKKSKILDNISFMHYILWHWGLTFFAWQRIMLHFSTQKNCSDFLASDGVFLKNDHQSISSIIRNCESTRIRKLNIKLLFPLELNIFLCSICLIYHSLCSMRILLKTSMITTITL